MSSAIVLAAIDFAARLLAFIAKSRENAARNGEWTAEERSAIASNYDFQIRSKGFLTDAQEAALVAGAKESADADAKAKENKKVSESGPGRTSADSYKPSTVSTESGSSPRPKDRSWDNVR